MMGSGEPGAQLTHDLCQPENLGAAEGRVEFVSTHASWVFLTADEVFKVKRPKNYGFLDYSTLEAREHFCREELRLNRRTAATVYRDVVPVYRDAEGHSLTRGGEIVDWAVRMQRLPDALSAQSLVEGGQLAAKDLDGVARLLADLYRGAQIEGPGPDLDRNLGENFEQVRPFAGEIVEASLLADVEALQRAWRDEHRELLATRPSVDGHGDLRLEHVYLMDDGPIAIDCIEFTERFRVGDPALDVAFLAMDLDRVGRPDLAEYLLGRFAYEYDDYDFWPIVDGYVSYRAFVRGKVACFVAADPVTAPETKQRKTAEATAFFELARDVLAHPPRGPRLIAVAGIIASGKSTLASELSRLEGWPVVSADATRKSLAGLAHEERAKPDHYSAAFDARVQDEVLRRARCVLEAGRHVIVDTTCKTRRLRARLRELGEGYGGFRLVECRIPHEVARARLEARRGGVSDARADLLDAFVATWEEIDELGAAEHIVLDTSAEELPSAEQLAERLRAK